MTHWKQPQKNLFPLPEQKEGILNRWTSPLKGNNYTLYGVIFYPSEQSETYPGIVFLWGTRRVCRSLQLDTTALAGTGYVVLLYDYRWSRPIRRIPRAEEHIDTGFEFLLQIQRNLRRRILLCHKHVSKNHHGCCNLSHKRKPSEYFSDSEKIGLIGHSLGSLRIRRPRYCDERIDAVVALSQGNILHAKRIDVPVQFQFGCFDITCSFPISFICYKKVQSPKELIAIQAGTHKVLGVYQRLLEKILSLPTMAEVCLCYAIGWCRLFLKNQTRSLRDDNDRLRSSLKNYPFTLMILEKENTVYNDYLFWVGNNISIWFL